MHLLGAFCCKMECYLFCNICIIVMQMLKFRNTHMKRWNKILVRRCSAPEMAGGQDDADGVQMLELMATQHGQGSAGQTILLRTRISSLRGLERSGRLHWIEAGPPISSSPSHFSFPNSWWSHPKKKWTCKRALFVSWSFYYTLLRGKILSEVKWKIFSFL